MATDEPFLWVLAGPLISSHSHAENKESGRWLECLALPKQCTGDLAKQHRCRLSECPGFSHSCRFAWQGGLLSFKDIDVFWPALSAPLLWGGGSGRICWPAPHFPGCLHSSSPQASPDSPLFRSCHEITPKFWPGLATPVARGDADSLQSLVLLGTYLRVLLEGSGTWSQRHLQRPSHWLFRLPLSPKVTPSSHCLLAKMLQLHRTLWPHGLSPARLLCPRDSPGKNTGEG